MENELRYRCAHCGSWLKASKRQTEGGIDVIEVSPCKDCLNEKIEDMKNSISDNVDEAICELGDKLKSDFGGYFHAL